MQMIFPCWRNMCNLKYDCEQSLLTYTHRALSLSLFFCVFVASHHKLILSAKYFSVINFHFDAPSKSQKHEQRLPVSYSHSEWLSSLIFFLFINQREREKSVCMWLLTHKLKPSSGLRCVCACVITHFKSHLNDAFATTYKFNENT